MNNNIAKKIKLVMTDVDGVLTDSGYIHDSNGRISKRFNTRDFYAIDFLIKDLGIPVMGLSGADDRATIEKFRQLNIPLAYGVTDKLSFAKKICNKVKIPLSNVAFIGDHWIDLKLIKSCGLSFCPKDSVHGVLSSCKTISNVKGGSGVIEDFLWHFFRESYENAHR